MIPRCEIETTGTIELYFYGELRGPERTQVQRHLRGCAECRQAVEDLAAISAALATIPQVASPPRGDWSALMARLEAGVRAEPRTVPQPRLHGRFVGVPVGSWAVAAVAMAAVLVLVTMAVLGVFGVLHRDTPASAPIAALPEASRPASDGPPDPALAALSGQHFARSKLVVLGLATRDTTADSDADWGYERDLASSLLSDTRLYRIAAEDRGMTSLAGVMRDLELVLLEASMTSEPDRTALEQVQRLIRRRDLVSKMNTAYVSD